MKLLSKLSIPHARAELSIPWLVNGSLPANAEPALREHISGCPACREDYEEQLRVRDAMRAKGPLVFAAESSYQKLLASIQKSDADREAAVGAAELGPPQSLPALRPARPIVRWLAAAVILQAFAIGIGAWKWHSAVVAGDARYVTLTSASASYDSGPRVRVLFRTDLPVGDLQKVLQQTRAQIIDGPADGDVYTLRLASPKQIAALRANPAVLFAEPVQKGVR
ncbi:MAG: anti-sigma factor family protein [Steroidobacteraceae bacterium]